MITNRKDRFLVKSVGTPVLLSGTFIFVAFMCIGPGCTNIGLSIQAARDSKKKAIPLFIISFVCSLCMGYLSGKDFDRAIFNWIAEMVNIIGQGAFLTAALFFRKS